MGDPLERAITWSNGPDFEDRYIAHVDGARWTVRFGEFPVEPLYTLKIDGVDPNSLWAQTAVDFLSNDAVNLCAYRGQVLMVVNIASQCGYTYEMADLQYLQDTFAAEGLHVLGFLSNDFGNQAGTQDQIEACNAQHHITFQEYAIAPVAASPQPVFAWLQAQPNPGPDDSLVPSWNFNKYVISKSGELVGKYDESEAWGTDASAPAFDASPAVQKVREALAE